MRHPRALRVVPPPKRPSASRSVGVCTEMPWHGGPSRASPSERLWNAQSYTACCAPPANPSPRRLRITSSPSRTALCSVAMEWPRGHATTPGTSIHPLSRRPDGCPGSHGPSLCRPPGDVNYLGSGCTWAHLCSPLPRPLFPSKRHRPTSSPSCWFPDAEGEVGRCFAPWSFLSPSTVSPRAPWPVSPLCARVASSLSCSPLLLLVSPVSFHARPVGSGAQHWRTTLDTERTCSCGQTDGRRNARSCKTTGTRIHSRRRRHEKPVVLVPWCLPLEPSPPPSPFPTLISWPG